MKKDKKLDEIEIIDIYSDENIEVIDVYNHDVPIQKKVKVKKKILLASIIVLSVFSVSSFIAWPYFAVKINLFGDKKITIDYGEKYSEPGFRAKLFNSNVTKDVIVESDIKESVGEYTIKYEYKPKLALYSINIERKVVRKDLSSPELTLNGEENMEVTVNTSYKEPGCKAIDNLDGDISNKVEILGDVNVKKLGNYKITYRATDLNGNTSEIVRNVKVEKLRPTQMSIKEYTLDGWYDEVKLKETKNMGDEYYKSVILVGDSNTMNLYLSGNAYPKQAWAVPSQTAESYFTRKINIYGTDESILLLDAVKKYKPKKMLLNIGTFSSSRITQDSFHRNTEKLIQEIKRLSPNTKLGLISIYPFDKKLEGIKLKQKVINDCNFFLLEMAHKYNLKFLDISSALKGSDGYLYWKYAYVDGWHLTNTGHRFVKEYIKTHEMED